jgi:polar amino acid transport system permease protein
LNSNEGTAGDAGRWRILRRIRPSYLILLAAVPFVIYLFWGVSDYRAALQFIAPGIGTTVIVTVFSYIIAAILGLGIAGLLLMKQGRRALAAFMILSLLFSAGALFFFTRPKTTYVLVGQPEGLVAIMRGTPQGLSRQIQAGTYGGGDAPARSIRAVLSGEDAAQRLAEGVVTGAFLPVELAPPGLPVLWEMRFLPAAQQNPALGLIVLALITALLTFAGWQSGKHPLAIFAELYVDMIRGIPMLVIILYIGFPIQGALRDLTGGLIEPDRLTRGIIAISLGYAAYMAEIFRAGIQAVPAGQVEAARSLGLNGWQTALHVVMPQALRIVIPPLGNEFIAMLKDTSLLSLLSLREVTQRTREFTSRTFEYFPGYNTVAILYIGLTLAAASALKFVERRTGRGERPA